jgi:hypothetical protein
MTMAGLSARTLNFADYQSAIKRQKEETANGRQCSELSLAGAGIWPCT